MDISKSDTTAPALEMSGDKSVAALHNHTGITAASAALRLPDKPLISIRPDQFRFAFNLRELWVYRELLVFLVWRDIKVRYKQTLLGAAWAILQPVLTTLVFTLFFGVLAGIDSDNVPYPVFAYAGLLPWTFFANSVTLSSNSLVGNANLITKVYFPRIIIPSAAVGAGLVDFAIAFIVLVGMMLYYSVGLTWSTLMLPLLALHITLFSIAVGMWLSALNVKYRDIRFVLPFLIQLWMFVSPVIYPASMVPQKWRWLLMLNPLTGIIENFRAALFVQKQFEWLSLGVSMGITVLMLIYSIYSFRRMEKHFADVI
jgi:lipopolysaccharide transport system permease protein